MLLLASIGIHPSEMSTDINGDTRIFGIIGYPVGHSMSPLIHNAAFQNKGLNAAYIPLAVPEARATLKKGLLAIENLGGVSVTIPHKAWACKIADERDALSECSGAANTLIRLDGERFAAHNTDGPGALEALRRNSYGRSPSDGLRAKRILLIGYGGSATAIGHSLLIEESPAQLIVAGRNSRKLKRFEEDLKSAHPKKAALVRSTDYTDLKSEDIDLIIHTTPLGMKGQPQELPLPDHFIREFHTVFDIVYNPARTPLIDHAARRKAKTVPGYLMLLYQATLQFELFTGEKAPENLMETELLRALRARSV